MTNFEAYKEELINILFGQVGIDKETGIPFDCYCNTDRCFDCKFKSFPRCSDEVKKWLNAEYVEPPVDWSKVEKDTKILVKHHEEDEWERRYFAKFENGHVYAYPEGSTSWVSNINYAVRWDYARLYKEGED